MAEKIGVGRNSYINFERGRTKLFNRCLYRMADYLGVPEEELLFGKRPDEALLRDQLALDDWKKQIIDDYETRIAAFREELEAARAELKDRKKTIDTLRTTNKFLLDELGKQR